jgi:DNA repair protein RecN (Recombination protein N)
MGLLELAVTDLAILSRTRVALRPGFTVITGETGAGKSLLIDALLLVRGARADPSLVRSGASAARVEALFDRDPEPLICVREVAATGRTVARIDDETVTVTRLEATVAPLVEIHGQHEQQRLLDNAAQRDLLDAYGDVSDLRDEVAGAVRAWRESEAALRVLDVVPAELARRLELADYAAAEIEAANVRVGEVEELRARLGAAANHERLTRLASEIHELLMGEGEARDRVGRAVRQATELARLDGRFEALASRLEGVEAELQDVASEVHAVVAVLEIDASERERLEERLGLLYGLLRKYGESEEQVLAHAEQSRTEADRLRSLDADRTRRQALSRELRARADDAAARLTAARRAAAARLAPAVTAALEELGFPSGSFAVEITPASLDPTGADHVEFVLAPNPGEPARPLARIASGGELSRVALAIKSALAAADDTPTLVFDEVDAGIGGRSAAPIGARLWQLARNHQVLVVTHLPQIAAFADAHLHIEKHTGDDGRTSTEVRELRDEQERLFELAAMLTGEPPTPAALAAAQDLVEQARALQVPVA